MKFTISETYDIKLTVDQIYQAIKELNKGERARLIDMILDGPDNGVVAKNEYPASHAKFYSDFNVAPGEYLAIDPDGSVHAWTCPTAEPKTHLNNYWYSPGSASSRFVTKLYVGEDGIVVRRGISIHWLDSLYQVPLDAYSIPANSYSQR